MEDGRYGWRRRMRRMEKDRKVGGRWSRMEEMEGVWRMMDKDGEG